MKTLIALALICGMLGCKHEPPPDHAIVMDCRNYPACPDGKFCQCLPGTFHPPPSFLIEDGGRFYKFTIGLENNIGWECEPTAVHENDLTVKCSVSEVVSPKGTGEER